MLGTIIGDIIGSVYEFDNIKHKDFPLFSERSRYTDDTLCTVAVADILLNNKPPTETLVEWCRKYPALGYGNQFMRWFNLPWQEPYDSFGNGAAMRVSPAGWLASTLEEVFQYSDHVTKITHNHPEGMKGARATAHSIFLARHKTPVQNIQKEIEKIYSYDLSISIDEIRETYEYNETCQGCVPQAISCALQAFDFEDAIRNAISIGGDSDTIAAITGGVAEALFGIDDNLASKGRSYLPGPMKIVIDQFYNDYSGKVL